MNTSGAYVVNYTYDAWGNIVSTMGSMASTLGYLNPLRYRGYVYDQETNLYYLQSRYYNPEWGRFLNADGLVATGQDLTGNNMFAYCGNNPVNRVDSTGREWFTIMLVVAVVAVFAVTLSSCSTSTPYSGSANCYAYALKLENDPRTNRPFQEKPQPGEFSGNKLAKEELMGEPDDIKTLIDTRVAADPAILNLTYEEVTSANHVAREGNWVVALAYSTTDRDYHWYRRDADGTWSHKPGTLRVRAWDASGNQITDPASCDRGNYDCFLGYYEVGPN